jgi:hypothetical protein
MKQLCISGIRKLGWIALVLVIGQLAAQVPQTPNLGLWTPPQGYPNWGALTNQNFTALDTVVGTLQHQYQGAWSGASNYALGQMVNYNSVTYIALAANVNHQPDTSPSYWVAIAGISALTGDATATGPGSAALTLASVNSSFGSCGDSTHVCQVTTDAKGRVTSQSAVAVSGGGGGGMANPMTTAGDIITGGSSGTPQRLAAGSAGYYLGISSGAPAWLSPIAITALTGDATATGPGSSALTLASVNSSFGSCGDSTHICQVTTDAKGRITAQTQIALTSGVSQVSGGPNVMVTPSGGTGAVTVSLGPAANTTYYIDSDSRGAVSTTCFLSAAPTVDVAITSSTVASNVLTATATNTLQTGDILTLWNFSAPYTGLNGQKVTVLSSGLSTSQFSANVTGASNGSPGTGAAGCMYNLSGYMRQEPYISGHGTVVNGTTSSQTSALINTNYSSSAHTYSPSVTGNPGYLIVQTGGQDYLNSGFNLTTVENNIKTFLSTARNDGWSIIMTTVIPHADSIFSPAPSNLVALNAFIRTLGPTGANVAANQYWDKLVDTAVILPDWTDSNYYLTSGTEVGHLTDLGAKVWSDAINNAIGDQQTPFWTQLSAYSAQGTVTYTSSTNSSAADSGKLVIMNCSSPCTYSLQGSLTVHFNTFEASILSIGSAAVSLGVTGSTQYNGLTTGLPTLTSFQPLRVWLDSTDAFGYHFRGAAPLVAGTGITLTPTAAGMTIAASGAAGITDLTGDATATGPGSAAITLATVNSGPGSCGDSTHVCQVTTDAKGRVTSQSAVAVSGGGGGMANPMTTAGDIITGGSAGSPGRLAVGSNGSYLGVSSGAPAWIAQIANIQITLPTSSISANTCTSYTATTMTGAVTTTTFNFTPAATTTGVTGWDDGTLYIRAYPTADTVNWKVCNSKSSSQTPGALTANVSAK